MLIKCDKLIEASLDGGLTVTAFPAGESEVPDWVGEMAQKHYGAKKISEQSSQDDEKGDSQDDEKGDSQDDEKGDSQDDEKGK